MATHSSALAWKIPWMEEPHRLQSMGSLRVGQTERLHFHFSLSCIGEGNGNPLQCSCLENPRDGGAWWAAVCGVAQSRTRLKRRSSSMYLSIFGYARAPLLCRLSPVAESGGYSRCRAQALGAQVPVVASCGLQSTGSVVATHGLDCFSACGIFPDQGLNPCLLHWQVSL